MDRSVHDLIAFSTSIVYLCVCFLSLSFSSSPSPLEICAKRLNKESLIQLNCCALRFDQLQLCCLICIRRAAKQAKMLFTNCFTFVYTHTHADTHVENNVHNHSECQVLR